MKSGITKLKSMSSIIWIGIASGMLFWILDSFMHVFIFREGSLSEQFLSPQTHEIWGRLLVAGIIIIVSVYAQSVINHRNRAEEAVREKEKFLDSVFDAIQDGISVLTSDLNIVRANSSRNSNYSKLSNQRRKRCRI